MSETPEAGRDPGPAGPRQDELKPITALFADVVGSTSLGEKLPPDEVKALIGEAVTRMAAAVEEFGGTVQAYMGDGICAYFGVPVAHEDDPERAALAALRIVATIKEFSADVAAAWSGAQLDVRVGINSGQTAVGLVGASDPQAVALGDTTNTAARLQSAAAPGTVAVGAASMRRLRDRFRLEDAGTAELKGKAEPVPFWRLVGAAEDAGEPRPAALFGRDGELGKLRVAVEELAQGRGQIVVVSGEGGIGKTRLIEETRALAGERALWLQARGLSYGVDAVYWPVIEVVRRWLGVRDGEAEIAVRTKLRARLDALGASNDLFVALARLLSLRIDTRDEERLSSLDRADLETHMRDAIAGWVEAVAAHRPTVVAIDDFHWVDPATAAATSALLSITDRAPVMLLLAVQPPLEGAAKDVQVAALTDYAHRSTQIALGPLDEGAAHSLADSLAPGAGLDPAATQAIVKVAEGNPLYLEELIAALIEGGELVRERTWTLAGTTQELLPAALEGLLAARIDRLPEDARRCAQAAAVIGRTFAFRLLEEVASDLDLAGVLPALLRQEIVHEERRYPELEYTFKHGLLQEAVLATLTPRNRRELHGKVAAAYETLEPEALEERLDQVAFHYYRSDDLAKALEYCERAASRAESLGNDEAATELNARAEKIRAKQADAIPSRPKIEAPPPLPTPTVAPSTDVEGQEVGGYRVGDLLGEGATGRVYRAESRDGTEVALKLLKPELVADEVFRRRFLHEARAASEVTHDHLVDIVDTGESDGRLYLAMRYLPGRSLAQLLGDNGPLEAKALVRVVGQVGSALDALHAAGIVHRDVKPSNIMIDESGETTLTDFGLAKGRAYTVLTRPGQVMGTLDYLAPEILRGEEATAASDIYSLGCIAFECVAGTPPFGDRSMFQVGLAHMVDEPPDPLEKRSDLPEATGWTILQALSKDAGARPPSGVAFANLLKMGMKR